MSSGSVYRRSKGDSSGSNDDGDEEEEKGSEITVAEREKESKRKKRRVFGRHGVGVRSGKKALLFRFRKFQKLFELSLSSASPSDSPNSGSRKNSSWFCGKSRFGGGLCCCACFSKPHVVEDDDAQGNVVPDDPEEFSYEHLKSMIEKNDFYSKECDTHFDD